MHFMLTLLKGLVSFSERPLYKEYVGSPENPAWRTITYSTFLYDLEVSAIYFQQQFYKLGVERNDVVGLWITGSRYEDLVNLYAIIRAGFVPQVFSLVMETQGGTMINDLLSLHDGKVVVLDPYYKDHVTKIAVPTLLIPDLPSLSTSLGKDKLLDLPQVDDAAIAMIFHTSGTTSGRPKPVPESHKWLRYQSDINWPRSWQSEGNAQKCFNNVGSLANVASATIINKIVPSGHCIIRTSRPDFDAVELLAMVNVEGLNNMLLYANRLSLLLGIARTNPDVLKILSSMQQISYTGEALNPDDIRWIIEQDLPVVAIYASTEVAICLVSDLKEPSSLPSMRPVEDSNIQFIPREDDSLDHRGKLCDLFVPAEAPNCPHISIRNRPNGHVTGDLFEETTCGHYIFRGRSDDWLKSGKDIMGLCDTKAIEDAANLLCADLVQNCVVVGYCKPIVLFVEPTALHADSIAHPSKFKNEIIQRMDKFQAGLFPHERFDNRVVVVARGKLPRTSDKGNIRRNAVEAAFAEILKDIYSR